MNPADDHVRIHSSRHRHIAILGSSSITLRYPLLGLCCLLPCMYLYTCNHAMHQLWAMETLQPLLADWPPAVGHLGRQLLRRVL